MEIKNKEDSELKQIAMDLCDGKIFCDLHLSDRKSNLPLVFLPIAFGAFKDEEDVKNIGLVYEYLSEAGPRGINGFPNFTSMRVLNIRDAEIMMTHHDEYKKIKDSFKDSEKTA